jgi:hypothetical protein
MDYLIDIEMHAQLHQSQRFKDCHVCSIAGDTDSHPGCFEQLVFFVRSLFEVKDRNIPAVVLVFFVRRI